MATTYVYIYIPAQSRNFYCEAESIAAGFLNVLLQIYFHIIKNSQVLFHQIKMTPILVFEQNTKYLTFQ